jgi:hypothetical protein
MIADQVIGKSLRPLFSLTWCYLGQAQPPLRATAAQSSTGACSGTDLARRESLLIRRYLHCVLYCLDRSASWHDSHPPVCTRSPGVGSRSPGWLPPWLPVVSRAAVMCAIAASSGRRRASVPCAVSRGQAARAAFTFFLHRQARAPGGARGAVDVGRREQDARPSAVR